MNNIEAEIMMLVGSNDKCPVQVWFQSVRDKTTRARILRQIHKLKRGLGVQKGLQDICELKIDTGPGYRVYYTFLDNKTLVVLIGGGDKSSQSKDIKDARELWESFERSGRPRTALRPWNEEQEQQENQDVS